MLYIVLIRAQFCQNAKQNVHLCVLKYYVNNFSAVFGN